MKNSTIKAEKNILTEVVIEKTHAYRKSYANYNDFLKYAFAEIKGDWIYCYDELGIFNAKHMLSAKHFHGYTSKVKITERAMRGRVKKAWKIRAQKNAKRDEAENQICMELENKRNELKATLKIKVAEEINRIKEIITLEDIESRFEGSLKTNEICNRAVGIVGYNYAKEIGWFTVLSEIRNQIQ